MTFPVLIASFRPVNSVGCGLVGVEVANPPSSPRRQAPRPLLRLHSLQGYCVQGRTPARRTGRTEQCSLKNPARWTPGNERFMIDPRGRSRRVGRTGETRARWTIAFSRRV